MTNQNQSEKERVSRRRGRGCLVGLGAGLAALLGFALVGYIYKPIADM